MSQYAYIPASHIDQVTQNYSVIGPRDWQFEKDGQQYGGMEDIIFTPAQVSEIESLGGEWFENASAFQNWLIDSEDPMQQKRNDINFGNSLLLEFLAGQKDLSLDNSTYRAVSEMFHFAEIALRRGDIVQAKTELLNIELYPPVWTQDAKDYFIGKIDNYIGV